MRFKSNSDAKDGFPFHYFCESSSIEQNKTQNDEIIQSISVMSFGRNGKLGALPASSVTII